MGQQKSERGVNGPLAAYFIPERVGPGGGLSFENLSGGAADGGAGGIWAACSECSGSIWVAATACGQWERVAWRGVVLCSVVRWCSVV